MDFILIVVKTINTADEAAHLEIEESNMPSTATPPMPNILLLMVDQMRFDAMRCAGNTYIQTPNLDRMASEGMRFTQAYSNAPVCIPARYSTITGQRCPIHGRYGNVRPAVDTMLPTLPQVLGLTGYHTQAIGKMHWWPKRRHYGFHRMELMEEIPARREDDEYLMYLQQHGYGNVREVHGVRNLLYHLPQVSTIPEEHHGSTWVADRTVDFLRKNSDRPFFCFSSWIAPHPPWNPPEPFASMYDPDDLPLPEGWDRDLESLPYQVRRLACYADVKEASPEILRRIKALYYGSISLVDKGVGRILDTLDALGLSENTMVLFTSDHGEMLGDQHCFQKSNPYEPSAHVPLLMRMPGRVKAGRVSDELTSLLDIMPTVLDLAHTAYPGGYPLPGSSLVGREGGGQVAPRQRLVLELGIDQTRWLSLREGEWRYSYYFEGGWEELYNLRTDPTEQRNLLLEVPAEHQARAQTMKALLTEWERTYGYSSSITEDGHLRSYEATPCNSDHGRLNRQFPRWIQQLPPSEQAEMRSIGESLLSAMQYETTYGLEDLKRSGSLERWQQFGGSLADTRYAHLLKEHEPREQETEGAQDNDRDAQADRQ